jgi:2-polyprenyl-6-methoxyphenol hydroxylase-like FAD-dependent oxidoreductase
MSRIIVIGGSVAGLSAALLLARAGHTILVLDGDDVSSGDPAEVAARAFRPGAPHAVQTHAFIARGRTVLRDRLPDVLAGLYSQGVLDLPLPPPLSLGGQQVNADPDLVFLMCRRPLTEWALRWTADRQHGVEVRSGAKVTGLQVDRSGKVPRVIGVVTETDALAADLVIDASGRRPLTPRWLAATGEPGPVVRSENCGLVYFSRSYRIKDGVTELPALNRGFAAGAVLPRFTALLAPCENGHVLAAVTPSSADTAMKNVRRAEVFDAVLRTVGAVGPWLDVLEPTSDVYAMGGLQSTLIRLVRDGVAVAHGLHVIGDACSTTSPTYGRGLSFALAHAAALTDTIAAHPDDLDQQTHALDEWVTSEIAPYYDEAIVADRSRLQMIHRAMHGTTSAPPVTEPIARHDPQRPSFLDVLSASFVDAYAWHRFARYQSLLAKPSELYDDPVLRDRITAADRDPMPPPAGPTNDELSEILR